MSGYTVEPGSCFHPWTGGQADPFGDDCWRCAEVPATTPIGLCRPCLTELREEP